MDLESPLAEWKACSRPGGSELRGSKTALQPLDWKRHGPSLFANVAGEPNADLWRYIPFGPFPEREGFEAVFEAIRAGAGWETMVVVDLETAEARGMASYMEIREAHGVVEIGCVVFGHGMQRTFASTEALYLMARHVFDDLGYRRYEWKCDDANEASKRAARRFGFEFEGVFRNHQIVKGRNRDTAWFSIIDREWPDRRRALESWLAPDNFDESGHQKHSL
ncbi:MAG TPA: N-acetyltransferase [Deltaproteobacteria bacterium]|nr:N-acetyltransferase [Deltaproteobacteria bacterium]